MFGIVEVLIVWFCDVISEYVVFSSKVMDNFYRLVEFGSVIVLFVFYCLMRFF